MILENDLAKLNQIVYGVDPDHEESTVITRDILGIDTRKYKVVDSLIVVNGFQGMAVAPIS